MPRISIGSNFINAKVVLGGGDDDYEEKIKPTDIHKISRLNGIFLHKSIWKKANFEETII